MSLCCVTTWLQESDAESQVGEFVSKHPLVIMPVLAEKPKLQPRCTNWVDTAMTHPGAWRQLWELVCKGFYLTAATGMQHLEEAGVQTLLASVLVGYPMLLGSDVKLKREQVLLGSERRGPIEFVFKSNTDVITVIVEVKTPNRMECAYSASTEQLYAEMYAAWEHNTRLGKGEQPVLGTLVDGVGALMFQLSLSTITTDEAATSHSQVESTPTHNVQGSISCSGYMCLFDTNMTEPPTPGRSLGLWLRRLMAAVLPECHKWEEADWEARKSLVTTTHAAWSEDFIRILDAMQ